MDMQTDGSKPAGARCYPGSSARSLRRPAIDCYNEDTIEGEIISAINLSAISAQQSSDTS